AVDFDAGVGGVLGDGGVVAEHHDASGVAEEEAGAIVAGGVVAEGFAGDAGFDEGLDDAPRGPRFFAAGLENDGDAEGDGGNPEGVDGGGVAGEDDGE